MSLALVGFMGSGKTTTANQLKNYYKTHKIFSIDEEIEKNNNKSIKDIFKIHGENYFRTLENKTIESIIINNKNCILDLGGGAFIQECNRLLLKEKNIKTIFLDVPFEEICRRLENQHHIRPMLGEKNWKENAKNLFEYRYNFYKQADLIIKINENCDSKIITKEIMELIEQKHII